MAARAPLMAVRALSGSRVSLMAVDLSRATVAALPMVVDRRRVAAEEQCEIQSNLLQALKEKSGNLIILKI